jgi:hypothetical protein
MQEKKIEIGDIFELKTKKGNKIYFQCVQIPDDTKNEVELIKVYYNLLSETPSELESITNGEFFFCRFPLKVATHKKIVKKIGNHQLPENFELPKQYRTTNFTDDAWQIVDAKTLKRETTIELTEEQKKLSPWGGMNDTLIIELLERGWKLENWTLDNMFLE